MANHILLAPSGLHVGLTAVAKGLVRALENQGWRVAYFKPVSFTKEPHSLTFEEVENYLRASKKNELLEKIIEKFSSLTSQVDIIVTQGIVNAPTISFATSLNADIAQALNATVVLIGAPGNKTPVQFAEELKLTAISFGGMKNSTLSGCIINKINAPTDEEGNTTLDVLAENSKTDTQQLIKTFQKLPIFNSQFPLIATIPWNVKLFAPRVMDIIQFLDATVINAGEATIRRIHRVTICARTVPNMLNTLHANTVIVTAGDRIDIIIATCVAALKGIKIAALVLTGDYPIEENVMNFCREPIERSGLPILSVKSNTVRTALRLQSLNMKVPPEDKERLEESNQFTAEFIDTQWIQHYISRDFPHLLSPPAFRYQLVKKAQAANKRIVLPEGNEPRTIMAAALCSQRRIAHCILLGDEKEIRAIAKNNDIALPDDIRIIDPNTVRTHYVSPMVKLRQHKNLTPLLAQSQLQDNVVLGTMMVQQGDADGLVSGAMHTTANTIRPALQLIKTPPEVKLVSSIFFMCMPEQVLVFGDCAVNPDPNAEELADIAIQSAESAKAFGVEPRIAMISYSTGESGEGSEVQKVREATQLIRKLRPDLLVDGPLQYDAALIESVAKNKAPQSPVAGRATVFIFPDLNTGNTTYKAVQRSANVLCIGPMLQGLCKPVNDLSRGATVDDIVYTIAITAIQASQREKNS